MRRGDFKWVALGAGCALVVGFAWLWFDQPDAMPPPVPPVQTSARPPVASPTMTAAAASAAPDFVASLRPKPAPVQPVVVSVPATAVPRPSLATRSDPGTANAAAQAERPALVQQTDAAQAIAPRPVTPVATRNPP